MKTGRICALIGVAALLLSGCYTVIQGPRTAADLDERDSLRHEEEGERSSPDRFDPFGDSYRYPGTPGASRYRDAYGYGGYPFYGVGYSSAYGLYGSLPYYGYGYGPAYYGYDPYYRSDSGSYVPVGYALVTERELEELRASRQALSKLQRQLEAAEAGKAEKEQQEQRRREEEAWQRRVEPRVRPAPVPTPRAPAVSSSSSSPPASRSAASSGAGSSKPSGKKKTSAKPRKTRR